MNFTTKYKILFVCMGNICRSPAAEGIMLKKLENRGLSERFHIDSAGLLNYHEGELPYYLMRKCGKTRGYNFISHSRPVKSGDLKFFDFIICMDYNNIHGLRKFNPTKEENNKIKLMTDYCVKLDAIEVPDPYGGKEQDYEYVLDLLEDACDGLIDSFLIES